MNTFPETLQQNDSHFLFCFVFLSEAALMSTLKRFHCVAEQITPAGRLPVLLLSAVKELRRFFPLFSVARQLPVRASSLHEAPDNT